MSQETKQVLLYWIQYCMYSVHVHTVSCATESQEYSTSAVSWRSTSLPRVLALTQSSSATIVDLKVARCREYQDGELT